PAAGAGPSTRAAAARRAHAAAARPRGYCVNIPWALQGPLHLDAFVALDLVADLDVVVVLDADAALGAGTHLVDVILEAAQRLQRALEDDHVVAQDADRVVASNRALDDKAAGDLADLRRLEHLAHFRKTDDLLAGLRGEHARERLLDLVDGVVDDRVVVHVHAGLVDLPAGGTIGTHVEPDDHRLRGGGEVHVGLGDAADAGGDHLHLHLVGAQLGERIRQRFHRALHVGLDDEVEDLGLALLHLAEHVLELGGLLAGELHLAQLALAVQRDFARLALVGNHDGLVTRGGNA